MSCSRRFGRIIPTTDRHLLVISGLVLSWPSASTCFEEWSSNSAIPCFIGKAHDVRVIDHKSYPEGTKWREERSIKASKNLFKFCYYVVWTILGYYVIKDLEGLPPMMFGKGSLSNLFKGYPAWDKPAYFDLFFCASIGYHLESFVMFFFQPVSNDFVEMILHHVTTIMLILFSYHINTTQVGVLVLWLHHWADIFTSGARTCMDIKNHARDIFFGGIIISWNYS